MKPNVAIISLGGTIAAAPGKSGRKATMDLSVEDIVRLVPSVSEIANLRAETFLQRGSVDLDFDDIRRLATHMDSLAGDVDGFVLLQGTDTLEETAFLLDLIVRTPKPIVVTGAMRNSGLPGADGPANLLHAVRVASSNWAYDIGVVVVFNDEIHSARYVRKMHATSTATFSSPGLGPIGWVSEDRVRIPLVPRQRLPKFEVTNDDFARVALVKFGIDPDPEFIDLISADRYDGMVIETYGAGHIASKLLPALERAAKRFPVVFASRSGTGEMHTSTCDFAGSELRLLERGITSSVAVEGLKARILLTLLLSTGIRDTSEIASFMELASS